MCEAVLTSTQYPCFGSRIRNLVQHSFIMSKWGYTFHGHVFLMLTDDYPLDAARAEDMVLNEGQFDASRNNQEQKDSETKGDEQQKGNTCTYMSHNARKWCLGFPTRFDTNRSVPPQKMARSSTFRI